MGALSVESVTHCVPRPEDLPYVLMVLRNDGADMWCSVVAHGEFTRPAGIYRSSGEARNGLFSRDGTAGFFEGCVEPGGRGLIWMNSFNLADVTEVSVQITGFGGCLQRVVDLVPLSAAWTPGPSSTSPGRLSFMVRNDGSQSIVFETGDAVLFDGAGRPVHAAAIGVAGSNTLAPGETTTLTTVFLFEGEASSALLLADYFRQ